MKKLSIMCFVIIMVCLLNVPNISAEESNEEPITFITNAHFDWKDVIGAKYYKVQILNNNKVIDEDKIESTISRYVTNKVLQPGDYYFKVFAVMAKEQDEEIVLIDNYKFRINEIKNNYFIPRESSTKEIIDIFEEAKVNSPCKIIFEKATYNITSDIEGYLFDLSDSRDIFIEGNDSIINIINLSNQSGLFKLNNCTNVSIQNFSFNYQNNPYVELKISDIQPNLGKFNASVNYDNGCFNNNSNSKYGYVLNNNRIIKLATKAQLETETIKEINNKSYEIVLKDKSDINYLHKNDLLIYKCDIKDKPVQINDSTDIMLKSIDINSCFDISIQGYNNENLKLINLCCDAIKLKNSKVGPWIEGCILRNSTSDLINLTCNHYKVVQVLNQKEIICTGDNYDKFNTGDWIVFNYNLNGPKIFEGKLQQVERIDNKVILKFYETLPKSVIEGAYVINHNYEMGEVVIRNNNLFNSFKNGIKFTCNRGLLENNKFSNINETAIEISPNANGGSVTNDLVISDNLIENCGKAENSISGICLNYGEDNCYCNRNINIKNNYIIGFWSCAIDSQFTDNSQIQDNKIINDCRIPKGKKSIVNIDQNSNLLFKNNIIIDDRERIYPDEYINVYDCPDFTLQNPYYYSQIITK